MELKKSIIFKINDYNCEFRNITESDVSQDYVTGLKKHKEYIEKIPNHVSLMSQKKYVHEIHWSVDDTIFGLFVNNKLIGTSGVQSGVELLQYFQVPAKSIATIGIFIFDENYQKMGLGKTLVWASSYLFLCCTGSEWFGAGMKIKNIPSMRSFLSCGFRKINEDEDKCRVLINYSNLIKPGFIHGAEIRNNDNPSKKKMVESLK